MKTKLLTIAFILTLCSGISKAQTAHAHDRLTSQAQEMALQLKLNEFRYIQLKKLYVEKADQTAFILDNYTYNPDLLELKLAEMNYNQELRMRAFLNADQLEAYIALGDQLNSLIAIGKPKSKK